MFVLVFAGLLVNGVFGFTDEMKHVSVMEGDSVTLHVNFTEIQKAEMITWTFGAERIRIAQINNVVNKVSIYDDVLDGRFRDKLKLDHQTGDLTITDITTEHAGDYELQTFGGNEAPAKKFNIAVCTHLPVPVIIMDSTACSSYCSVVCSVVNVSAVSLSWYNGSGLLSSISVSDLSISLSLPLEVEYQENNTYSCVINNTISNHTTHLDINTLCQPCEAPDFSSGYIALAICIGAGAFVLILILRGVCCNRYRRMRTQAASPEQPDVEEHIMLTNGADSGNTGNGDQSKNDVIERDEISSLSVMLGHSITLQTGITEIQETELIQWKFAKSEESNSTAFVVIAEWDKTNNTQNLHIGRRFRDLEVNHTTGSLTIRRIKHKHYGYYKLNITSEGQKISKTFSVVAVEKTIESKRKETKLPLMMEEETINIFTEPTENGGRRQNY